MTIERILYVESRRPGEGVTSSRIVYRVDGDWDLFVTADLASDGRVYVTWSNRYGDTLDPVGMVLLQPLTGELLDAKVQECVTALRMLEEA